MFHLVNLALSKFSEKWKGSRTKGLINKPEWKWPSFLTLGPSGCCPLMGIGPAPPQGGGRGLTCCKATRSTDRTVECGTDWRSRPPRLPWQSCLSGRWRWRSGFPFAVRGLGRHRGRVGLKWKEERRDRADNWGPLGTTGSPLGFDVDEEGKEQGIATKHEHQHKDVQTHIRTQDQHQWKKVTQKNKWKEKNKKSKSH